MVMVIKTGNGVKTWEVDRGEKLNMLLLSDDGVPALNYSYKLKALRS